MTNKKKDNRFNKYSRYANKIKLMRTPVAMKRLGFGEAEISDIDWQPIIEKCTVLYEECLSTYTLEEVQNKFWFKILSEWAKK